MKKRLILLFLTILFVSGCAIVQKNNEAIFSQPATMTPFQPEYEIATPTAPVVTKTILPTLTITPTPTPTPDPYIIFPDEESIDLGIGEMFISFYEGSLEGLTLATYLVSPKDLGGYNSTKDGLDLNNVVTITNPLDGKSVETHVSVIRPEVNGNLLVSMHSGGYNNTLLDAENLRFYFERWGKNGEDYTLDRLAKIAGSKGILYFNDVSLELEALGGVRLEPDDSQKINTNPEQVVELILKSEPETLGNVHLFEGLSKSTDKHLLITFCGWGPDNDYSYYRYVVVFRIKREST